MNSQTLPSCVDTAAGLDVAMAPSGDHAPVLALKALFVDCLYQTPRSEPTPKTNIDVEEKRAAAGFHMNVPPRLPPPLKREPVHLFSHSALSFPSPKMSRVLGP